jgi:hypothetical protein
MPFSPGRCLGVVLFAAICCPFNLSALTSSSVALTASPGAPAIGNVVTLTATVTPASATGKVTFYDGTTVLGTGTLSGNVAGFSAIMTATGPRSFRAHYSGDSTYQGSNSAAVNRMVSAVPSFGFTTTSQPAQSTRAGAVGDFNNDGKLDLVAESGGVVNVYLGNGSGTFGSPISSPAPSGQIAVGDFNGDGKLDLAILNFSNIQPQFVRVMLGNGDGTFTLGAGYAADYSPTFPTSSPVVVADFNKDGKPDLAVIHSSTSSIDIMLGNGDGTFGSPIGYPVGTGVTFAGIGVTLLKAGDFNGDGKPDLLSYSQAGGDQTFSVLLGNGDGTFAAAITFPAGIQPAATIDCIVVGDLNGDGKPDLAAASADDPHSSLKVYIGNGDGTFAAPADYPSPVGPFPGSAGSAIGMAMVDVNGDGKPDIVVDRGAIQFYPGNGDGTLQPEGVFPLSDSSSAMLLAEVDGDGRVDLVVPISGGSSDSGITVLHGSLAPFLRVTMSHNGDFLQTQSDAKFTIQVSNAAGAATTSGTITVSAFADQTMRPLAMSGPGWTCPDYLVSVCTRSDGLAANTSYPPITFTVLALASSTDPVPNSVNVSGGGSLDADYSDSVAIIPLPTNCTYTFDPGPISVGPAGGDFSMPITTQTGCGWGATHSPDWLTVSVSGAAAGGSGDLAVLGSGELHYHVDPNPAPTSRFTFIFMSGEPGSLPQITINQGVGSCSYQLATTSASLGSAGGNSSVGVTAPSGCNWSATSNAPWLMITSAGPGSANGTVSYSVAANPTAAQRVGTLTIAGQTVTVTQSPMGTGPPPPPACTFIFSADTMAVPAAGSSLVLTITTQAGCPWQVLALDGWVNVTSPLSGTGIGTVNFAAAPNSAAASRSTSLFISSGNNTVGTIAINQAGTACIYHWLGTSGGFEAKGGSAFASFTVAPGCPWTVTTDVPWLTLTSPNVGIGDGMVFFTAAANPNTFVRNGSLSIFGEVYSIGQAPAVLTSAHFVPITPCRVADTRNANGLFGGPVMGANTSRDFGIPSSACNIPATASAYSLNVAVVPHGPLGYLTLWPAGQPQPLVATLNSDGRIKSNAAIVPAGTSGAISAFATNSTDLVIDINGYFVPANDSTALAFYPLTPCRIADTRDPGGPLGGPALAGQSTRSFPIRQGACNLPAQAQAYVLNFAAVPHGPLGYLTVWPSGQNQPLAASLNALTGTVTANAVLVPAGDNGDVSVFASDATDLVIDISGYFAPLAEGGLAFYNLPPCRVSDTRNPPGSAPARDTIDISVAPSSCGPPNGVLAYVFNATVVPPGPFGYLTMWPQGQPQPLAATLNAVDGAITSNMAIIPTMTDSVSLFLSNPTHVVLDVFGYFGPEIPIGP